MSKPHSDADVTSRADILLMPDAAGDVTSRADILLMPDAAEYVGRTIKAMEWLRYTGTGPKSGKLAGRVVYRRADLDAWIASAFAADPIGGGDA